MSFKERAAVSENKHTQRLLSLMEEKKSNLAVSVDLTLSNDILQVADGGILQYMKYNVMILIFQTDRSGQTVQTQIRLLLEKQSDQGLHCLLFHLHLFDEIP